MKKDGLIGQVDNKIPEKKESFPEGKAFGVKDGARTRDPQNHNLML
jgi:hypothetical protein